MSFKVSHRRQSLLTGSLKTSDISGKGPVCQCRRCKRLGFEPWVGKIPREGHGNPFQFSLPGESHGHKTLVGYSS